MLVVDDDEYTRVFAARFLPGAPRVAHAGDGRQALEAVMAALVDPPDLVLMDLDMPVMGGLEAAARLREWEQGAGHARCFLIAMSSHDGEPIRAQSLRAGFDRFIQKPVSPDTLRQAIAELLQAPATLQPAQTVQIDADLRLALPGFLASRRELAGRLAEAVAAGQAEPARALAHKLAGSFSLYGFHWAAAQGKMIEQRARDNALEGLAAAVAALRGHLEGIEVKFAENRAKRGKSMVKKHKLLVVDDDEAIIDWLRAKLGAQYDIVSTNAPESVLALARKERPSLILCDIDMPEMDGGDVSKALYDDSELRDVPVLFITRLVSPSDMAATGHQIGGRPAISKQARPEELAKRIESLIRA